VAWQKESGAYCGGNVTCGLQNPNVMAFYNFIMFCEELMVQFIWDIFVRQHIVNVRDGEHFSFIGIILFCSLDLCLLLLIFLLIFLCGYFSATKVVYIMAYRPAPRPQWNFYPYEVEIVAVFHNCKNLLKQFPIHFHRTSTCSTCRA